MFLHVCFCVFVDRNIFDKFHHLFELFSSRWVYSCHCFPSFPYFLFFQLCLFYSLSVWSWSAHKHVFSFFLEIFCLRLTWIFFPLDAVIWTWSLFFLFDSLSDHSSFVVVICNFTFYIFLSPKILFCSRSTHLVGRSRLLIFSLYIYNDFFRFYDLLIDALFRIIFSPSSIILIIIVFYDVLSSVIACLSCPTRYVELLLLVTTDHFLLSLMSVPSEVYLCSSIQFWRPDLGRNIVRRRFFSIIELFFNAQCDVFLKGITFFSSRRWFDSSILS